jgi:hypothetical protein
MSGNIYISPPAATPTILNQDINLNSVLQGQVSYNTDINVFLEDSLGNPITPTGSVLVGNDLTATLATPNPNGVALQFPTSSQYTSYVTGDIGWRTQNGWFNYTPPAYPAKFAELDMTAGANSWYKLKTALTVGGVTSTERFVDINGVQSWGILNNANVAVIDKLTGLMFTRGLQSWGQLNYTTHNTNALAYSVVINGTTYDEWYLMSLREYVSIFGMFLTGGSWVDPISGLTITNSLGNTGLAGAMWLSDACGDNGGANKVQVYIQLAAASITNGFQNDARYAVRVHKAYNLIS